MAFAGPSAGGVRADINVTPLVDVVLVLLIIFMVVTPMLQRGKDVQLPKAHARAKDQKHSDPIVVSITADHNVWLESNSVNEAAISSHIASELQKTPNRRILLKGDATLSVANVRKVMDQAKKAGASGVELAIEELKSQ